MKINNFFNKRLIRAFAMGASSGFPLLLTITLMQAWAKDCGVKLSDIGLMALVGLPYTLKFLWSPIFDAFSLRFLKLGRRRGWLLIIQILLIISIIIMGLTNPSTKQGLTFFIIIAFLIAFFSASQDIVIDAYRREDLKDNELGLGSSYYIYGYRTAMLWVGGGGMILADYLNWKDVYIVMAILMLPFIFITLISKEPKISTNQTYSFKENILEPFVDYFKKKDALLILLFILLYKLGDTMATQLATPFYMELGFSKSEIGTIVKLAGFWATMAGAFIGGALMLRMSIKKALFFFGILQIISTSGFALLSILGKNIIALTCVISFENISAGMGTAAFVAFMARITNKKFTATQYSILTAFMGIPRVIASSLTGYLAISIGWFYFFILCTIIGLPGLIIIFKLKEKD